MKNLQAFLEKNIITVFSKSYCPYCIRTKNKLDNKGFLYKAFEVDENEVPNHIVKEMQKKTGHYTFPSVFIGDMFVGGDSDLTKIIQNGKFDKIVQEKGINKA